MSSATATDYAIAMTSSEWGSEVASTVNNVTWSSRRPEAEIHWTATTTARAVFEVTTLFVFFGLSVVGNILVCLVIHRMAKSISRSVNQTNQLINRLIDLLVNQSSIIINNF